ncbi:unnamed protein product [Schistosoma turkestanicum]|nr:unnamed protein product [Schistosoma turkestanicum]
MMIVKMIMLMCLAQCLVCNKLLMSEPAPSNNLTDEAAGGTDEEPSETKEMDETTDTTTTTEQDYEPDNYDYGGFINFILQLITLVLQDLFSFGADPTQDNNVTTQS